MANLARRVKDFVYWRSRRVRNRVQAALYGVRSKKAFEPVDPAIRYPSYKSLDPYLDVARLRSLDATVTAGVERCLASGTLEPFDTGVLKDRVLDPRQPGSRVIPLTVSSREFRYQDLNDCDLWQPGPAQELFPELMAFIATLPFERTARMLIMCDDRGREVTTHRDHRRTDILHEFIWFRTNLDKPFFVIDRDHKEKQHLRSYTAWFDTVNQYHGADAADRTTISIRVDGRFNAEFRASIPTPPINLASTPSYWAAFEERRTR